MHNDDRRLITDWIRHIIRKSLPNSCSDSHKVVKELFRVHSKDLEMIDAYSNYHQSFKWTDLSEHISYEISLIAMRYMPTFRTNFSPFRRQVLQTQIAVRKNPSLMGQSSTSSTNSNDSSSSAGDDSSTDEDLSVSLTPTHRDIPSLNRITSTTPMSTSDRSSTLKLDELLPTMEDVYGCRVTQPSKESIAIYKRYSQMGKLLMMNPTELAVTRNHLIVNGSNVSGPMESNIQPALNLKPLSDYGTDSYLSVRSPTVSEKSQRIYADYCRKPYEMDINSNLAGNDDKSQSLLQRYIAMA